MYWTLTRFRGPRAGTMRPNSQPTIGAAPQRPPKG